jgi:hypothetical protein
MNSTDTQPSYNERYYGTHKDNIAERRKKKYEEDEGYRKACIDRAKEYYRQNREAIRGRSRRVPTAIWPRGREEEVYQISALCEALNRKPLTVRLWIREGKIPDTPLRRNRIRYYTEGMIEAVVEAIPDSFRKDWKEVHAEVMGGWRKLGIFDKGAKVVSK